MMCVCKEAQAPLLHSICSSSPETLKLVMCVCKEAQAPLLHSICSSSQETLRLVICTQCWSLLVNFHDEYIYVLFTQGYAFICEECVVCVQVRCQFLLEVYRMKVIFDDKPFLNRNISRLEICKLHSLILMSST